LENTLPYNRICFTFPGRSKDKPGFENAVARNRARRLGREAYRLIKCHLKAKAGYDFILLVYPESGMALSGRMEQLQSLFIKAGLLK